MTFDGFDLEKAIAARARGAGLALRPEAVAFLASHARAVAEANDRLHLTSITDARSFVERHLGESLEGAARIPEEASGSLVDLGSGNGYPGIPIAAARPGLRATLIEVAPRKALFLRDALASSGRPDIRVEERNVQRAEDLEDLPPIDFLVTRAMGGWERLLPKLAPRLSPGARVFVWAAADLERIAGRRSWRRFTLERRHPLPGRATSAIAVFSLTGLDIGVSKR